MTLSYDAYLMQQLTAACQTANDEIVKAQQQIQAVKSHADWTCKEKSVIDELMEDCKNLINRMQEDQNGFLMVLKQVESELDGAEKSISNLFQGVESILSKVLSIPAAVSTVVGGGLIGAGAGTINGGIGAGVGGVIGGALGDLWDGIGDVINSDTVGTGGWIGGVTNWFEGIGSEIGDDIPIWHGPGNIGFPDIPNLPDMWEEVIGTGINPTGVVSEIIGQIGEPIVTNPGIGISDVVTDVIDMQPVVIPWTTQEILPGAQLHEALGGMWDTVTDVFEGPTETFSQWAETVVNSAIPICRMGDIQL